MKLNIPTPAEREAMRKRYETAKEPKPKPKPIGYCVYQCGMAIYGPVDVRLCWYFIKLHGLNTKPKAKYA